MDLEQLAVFLIIGGVAGWLAGLILKRGGIGVIGNIIVGVVGAVLGGFVFGAVGISAGGKWIGPLITATVGSIILLWVIGFVGKKK